MNDHIQQLLEQITALEDDLRKALSEQQSSVFFQIKGKRVEFEQSIKQTHRRITGISNEKDGPKMTTAQCNRRRR
jgi:hypothetical protein